MERAIWVALKQMSTDAYSRLYAAETHFHNKYSLAAGKGGDDKDREALSLVREGNSIIKRMQAIIEAGLDDSKEVK
jgi:hypothetical protein